MIHGTGRDRNPRRRQFLMTQLALAGAADMHCTFTAGGQPVMTTDTVIHKGAVIHRGHRHPGGDTVAGIAGQCSGNVSQALAGRNHIVMTG